MKLGVFSVLFQDLPFEAMLERVAAYGLEAVELGTGNYPGAQHCDPDILLHDAEKRRILTRSLESRHLIISALSCHGNPLHPNQEFARRSHDTWRKTVLLAEQLGVERINLFSGCPGDSEMAQQPNWVTCVWPPEYAQVLEWQWDQVVIPYWREEASFAAQHGVKLCFELHPGFVVYNPETLLKLRRAAGENIGANFDPSHLIWQGIDPVEAIKLLGRQGALFHFHAKDTYLDPGNIRLNGVLDTKPYGDVVNRSWTFRSVGFGQGEQTWKAILSTLRMVGYDWVVSIEHEDSLASVHEGLSKAVQFLQTCLLRERPAQMWWA